MKLNRYIIESYKKALYEILTEAAPPSLPPSQPLPEIEPDPIPVTPTPLPVDTKPVRQPVNRPVYRPETHNPNQPPPGVNPNDWHNSPGGNPGIRYESYPDGRFRVWAWDSQNNRWKPINDFWDRPSMWPHFFGPNVQPSKLIPPGMPGHVPFDRQKSIIPDHFGIPPINPENLYEYTPIDGGTVFFEEPQPGGRIWELTPTGPRLIPELPPMPAGDPDLYHPRPVWVVPGMSPRIPNPFFGYDPNNPSPNLPWWLRPDDDPSLVEPDEPRRPGGFDLPNINPFRRRVNPGQ